MRDVRAREREVWDGEMGESNRERPKESGGGLTEDREKEV